MTGPVTWVVGAGGLLGSSVVAALTRRDVPVLRHRVPWGDLEAVRRELRHGIAGLVAAAGDDDWNVAWCAGSGIVASTAEHVERERAVFAGFLDDLAAVTGRGTGAVFLASTAGGVYAGSPDERPLHERSAVRPLVPYGESRLAMERHLEEFLARTGHCGLAGRIANLYGPGQDLHKKQGLVSQICLAHVTGRPLTIFVPLDTLRDYVYVEDAGDLVAEALLGLRHRAPSGLVTKVVATGRSVSVGLLLAEAGRLFKRRVPAVVAAPRHGTGQAQDLRLRSLEWRELDATLRTALPVGIARTATDVALRCRSLSTVL
jgi:UDP-glucose 4-epimerase